jgi:glyoxylase-like metal-dependent hydrolase (beta-lactamase superfamily II)
VIEAGIVPGVTRLVDTVGILGTYEELFPAVAPESWTPYERAFPELFDDASWRLPFAAYLVRIGSTTILVDAGVGPPGGFLPDAQGLLLRNLDEAGAAAADVDVVFLTHLHADHVGWITTPTGEPTFPNATYVTHEGGRAWAASLDDARSRAIDRLEERTVLELLTGASEIADGVRAFETPGHAPGHMSLELTLAGVTTILAGDVAVHPAQLDHPDFVYLYEHDAAEAVRTRHALLDRISPAVTVMHAHVPPG